MIALCVLVAMTAQAVRAGDQDPPVLETVEVHGQRLHLNLQREQSLTPGGVTLIDANELYQRNVPNLAEMMRFAPGVWSDSAAGGSGVFLSIRGSNLDATDYDMNGVKLLQDGLPITTADGNNHNRLINPLSTRFATVARGANALTYGASTLGGAIDFNSPTALNSHPAQLFVSAGSHGRLNGQATAAGIAASGLDGLVTVESNNWDGYRDHSSEDSNGVYANTGWQLGGGSESRLSASYLNSDQKLPGALTRAQYEADPDQASAAAQGGDYQKNLDTWRLANKTHLALDNASFLEFGVSWEEQSLYHPIVDKVLVDFDGPGPAPPREVFSLLVDTDHRDFGAMTRYEVTLDQHNLLFGLNFGDGKVSGGNFRNDNGNKNGLTTAVDNTARNLEAFAMDRWTLAPRWTLVYGAQAVWAEREVENTEVESGAQRNPGGDYDSINPRVGALYDLSDGITLFTNASRLFEPPTNFELEDDIRGGNDTLDPMYGYVIEVGGRGEHQVGAASQWYWDAACYYSQVHDEILSVDDPLAPGTSLSANVDNTIHAGVETLVGASLALDRAEQHRIEPTLSLTLNDFSFDDDAIYEDNDLPAAPGYAVRGELLYRHASGVYIGPTFDMIDDRYADFSNTYKVDSYELIGLRAGYTNQRWEVFAEATNLLDKDYVALVSVRNVASPDAAVIYPGAPLSFYAGIRFQL
ncbi:MAG: TonB-dependent receptor [Halioglobus sp.]|nr:TonB-dependent receptor [Halioglobus sp.]